MKTVNDVTDGRQQDHRSLFMALSMLSIVCKWMIRIPQAPFVTSQCRINFSHCTSKELSPSFSLMSSFSTFTTWAAPGPLSSSSRYALMLSSEPCASPVTYFIHKHPHKQVLREERVPAGGGKAISTLLSEVLMT